MFHESNVVSTVTNLKNLAQNAGFRRLTPFQEEVLPKIAEGKDLFINTGNNRGKTLAALLSAFTGVPEKGKPAKALIISPDSKEIGKLGSLASNIISSNRLPYIATTLSANGESKREFQELSRNPDIIIGNTDRIIDQIRKKNLPMNNTSIVIVFIARDTIPSGFDKDLFFISSRLPKKVQTIFFAPKDEFLTVFEEFSRKPFKQFISQTEEKKEETMDTKNVSDNNEEFVKDKIKDLVTLIKSDKDPKGLDKYKKLIKKSVPLTMRSYIGAYLLRALIDESPAPAATSAAPSRGRSRIQPNLKASERPKATGNYTTLFFSIGKNRRVFPKDLTRFICTQLNMDSNKIGTIKILDSYSFVDIHIDHADAAVNNLNEQEFRGRKLTVNYAKKR
ncbi:MAG: DbpA RNA binding domain-containing protein [Spirochaetales bacterium]|nr:DbpA RNA binding domain-containing protein [Spirochaetales bacterium]